MAQTGDELTAQFTTRLGVDGGVDGFMGHPTTRLIGTDTLEGTRELLRRLLPVQQGEHQAPGHAIHVELGRRACCTPLLPARDGNPVLRLKLFIGCSD